MTLEQKTVRKFYKSLIALYPHRFREQFGESMEQTFNDLCRERQRQTRRLSIGFVVWTFTETAVGILKEHFIQIKRGKFMENIISDNKSSAVSGVILLLPFALLILIAGYEIEPFNGLLRKWTTEADGVRQTPLGLALVLGVAVFLPLAAFVVNFVPVLRNRKTRNRVPGYSLNFFLAALALFIITMLAGGILADQFPCWIGVPNCD